MRRGGAVLLGVLLAVTPSLLSAQQPASRSSSAPLNWRPRNASPARVTAQHSVTLAEATPQRIGQQPQRADGSVTALRWRTSGVVRARISSDEPAAPVTVLTVSDVPRTPDLVQQVSAAEPAIPYTVPNDADPPQAAAAPPLVPPQEPRELPRDAVSAPMTLAMLVQEETAPQEPELTLPPDIEPQDDPAPAPQPLGPRPQPLPAPLTEAADDTQCERVYNERDCCKDEQKCGVARQHWQADAISKISLDITPKLRLDADDELSERSERNLELPQVPVRTYRDRRGQELATGRLAGVQYGRVLVLDEANQVAKVPLHDLGDDDLCFLAAWWRVPTECTFSDEDYQGRAWAPSTFTWKASAIGYKPLYFEQPRLERYGHTTGHFVQPVLSGAHFFVSLVTLPYQAGINPPWECQYPLGYYRPGSCAPWLVPPVPLSVRGALWEAGAWVGGVALFP